MRQEVEIVRASEMAEKVFGPIVEVRYAAQIAQYEKDLNEYQRALRRGETEVEKPLSHDPIERITEEHAAKRGAPWPVGYQVVRTNDAGVKVLDWVQRPKRPHPFVWRYSPYDRSFGHTSHATQYGFLSNPLVNREINPRRVESYGELMEAGLWRDLLSDPITITTEGHVVNGQHRLAAISGVEWDKVENDPRFLIVFGIDPEEAMLADSSKRTGKDQSTIAAKVLAKASS